MVNFTPAQEKRISESADNFPLDDDKFVFRIGYIAAIKDAKVLVDALELIRNPLGTCKPGIPATSNSIAQDALTKWRGNA